MGPSCTQCGKSILTASLCSLVAPCLRSSTETERPSLDHEGAGKHEQMHFKGCLNAQPCCIKSPQAWGKSWSVRMIIAEAWLSPLLSSPQGQPRAESPAAELVGPCSWGGVSAQPWCPCIGLPGCSHSWSTSPAPTGSPAHLCASAPCNTGQDEPVKMRSTECQ